MGTLFLKRSQLLFLSNEELFTVIECKQYDDATMKRASNILHARGVYG
jgi:hypothetical protein